MALFVSLAGHADKLDPLRDLDQHGFTERLKPAHGFLDLFNRGGRLGCSCVQVLDLANHSIHVYGGSPRGLARRFRLWGFGARAFAEFVGARGRCFAAKVPAQVPQRLMRHANIAVTMGFYANVDAAVEEAVLGAERNSSHNNDHRDGQDWCNREDATHCTDEVSD